MNKMKLLAASLMAAALVSMPAHSQQAPGRSAENPSPVSGSVGNQGNDRNVGNAGGERARFAEERREDMRRFNDEHRRQRMENMTPEQRDEMHRRAEERHQKVQQMTPEQRDEMRRRAEERHQKFQQMPPEQRDEMRRRAGERGGYEGRGEPRRMGKPHDDNGRHLGHEIGRGNEGKNHNR